MRQLKVCDVCGWRQIIPKGEVGNCFCKTIKKGDIMTEKGELKKVSNGETRPELPVEEKIKELVADAQVLREQVNELNKRFHKHMHTSDGRVVEDISWGSH